MAQIHPLANVHKDAKLGENVIVEAFATVEADTEIGDGTWIGPNAVIFNGARIGKNCKIFPGAIISGIPQDLKFEGETSYAIIGDNTTIREFVTVNRGTKSKGKTIIGNNCLLMAYVHVAHDCIIGNHVILVNSVQIAGEVEIDDWAVLGGTTAVHQFVKIGKHVMVQGGSKLNQDVPPYVRAGRDPVQYYGVNSIGLRRRGFTNEQIRHIQDMYRILFQQGRSVKKAVEIIEKQFEPSEEREEILNFVRNSERGLIKGFRSDNDN